MASKNEAPAASSQYMLEVHMSTIYHKGGISLAQSSPLYSHRNEIMKILKKAMAPFLSQFFDKNSVKSIFLQTHDGVLISRNISYYLKVKLNFRFFHTVNYKSF